MSKEIAENRRYGSIKKKNTDDRVVFLIKTTLKDKITISNQEKTVTV